MATDGHARLARTGWLHGGRAVGVPGADRPEEGTPSTGEGEEWAWSMRPAAGSRETSGLACCGLGQREDGRPPTSPESIF